MKTVGPILGATAVVAIIAFAAGSGLIDLPTVLLVLVLSAVAVPLAARLSSSIDPWMWWVGPAAYAAKLVGAGARYAVLFEAYEGSGDAVRYHQNGTLIAEIWQSLAVPQFGSGSGAGTRFVDAFTGLIYAIHQPTMLGGFFIFATLAFFGQLLFYASFRRAVPGGRLQIYAGAIFFLPSLVFWPSSIGKEALMLFFLGIATYGLTRVLEAYTPGWVALAGLGLGGAGLVRPHVAALLAAAFAVSAMMANGRWLGPVALRRSVVIVMSILLLGLTVLLVGDRFAISSPDDIDPFVNEIERRTDQGGSAVVGGAISGPAQLPEAILRVLFRPLPQEAHNIQSLASAAENLALLGMILWRLPTMFRRRRFLRNPLVLMSATFTFGFVIAFSTIINLGILTRQRAQVLPLFLALIVALGWEEAHAEKPTLTSVLRR